VSVPLAYGIDFGTSNSSIAVAYDDGAEVLAVEPRGGTVLPSIVYVDDTRNRLAGTDAVQQYLVANPDRARLMSSLKTFLTDPHLEATESWGQRFTLPELVAVILRHLKTSADRQVGANVTRVVLGHPVLFVGAEGPNFEALQQLALDRLEEAAHHAGFTDVAFLDEPTAALLGEELDEGVMMALDFGGGTFDVSVIELAPEHGEVLAIKGAAIGGELFDALLFDAKLAGPLGLNRQYWLNDNCLPVPGALRELRTLSGALQMRSADRTRKALEHVRSCGGGEAITTLEEIVLGGHAYNFYRALEQAKIVLSSSQATSIEFRRPGIAIDERMTRPELESVLKSNLDVIDNEIDRAMAAAGVSAGDIDLVVRTGGSSRLPAFVQRLTERFGDNKVVERDAYLTVAQGLGMRAMQEWGA
jgi:hypothetical chaperone protein